MTDTTTYLQGQFNFYCDLCGKKAKSSQAVRTWDGFYVCQFHQETRNPQDFVRGVKDDQTIPWSRSGHLEEPDGGDILLETSGEEISVFGPALLLEDLWKLQQLPPATL